MGPDELPPPPRAFPLTEPRPTETRWWRRDVSHRSLRRALVVAVGLVLGSCVAMQHSEGAKADRLRRTAVAALAKIQIPGSIRHGPTASRGCDDYQGPWAGRTDRSTLSEPSLRQALAEHLEKLGWTWAGQGSTASEADEFVSEDLTLLVHLAGSGQTSTAELRIIARGFVC